MLSINTNLSSLIAQSSMSSSTAKLNQAVERMSTGFKINHAKDNAANYSISTNMSTQINAYDVAADNVAMGMDLVTTASDIISNMQNKASRLQALCTQARNGTYGATSLSAINSEAGAIMAEINRLYSTAEYNGISLFDRKAYTIASHLPQAGTSGFIDETAFIAVASADPAPTAKAEYNGFIEDPKTYTDEEVAAMTRVKDVSTFSSGQKYAIYTKEELVKLAEYVNDGNDCYGIEFVLGGDIDLSSISNWTPIGNESAYFQGTFDGNGHVIKNLTIDSTEDYQGLFGYFYDNGYIMNLGIENCNVKGANSVGSLVGHVNYTEINNCYATGTVSGTHKVGGLIGEDSSSSLVDNCYTNVKVKGQDTVGGLMGIASYGVTNSYATGSVSGTGNYVGGLVGETSGTVTNSYATGNVSGTEQVGGLVGYSRSSISNSYATGAVTGSSSSVGGLVGYAYYGTEVTNSYATGSVSGNSEVGGLVGSAYYGTVTNSYATGSVSGNSEVGGLVGSAYDGTEVMNSYATGSVSGNSEVGGLVGSAITYDVDLTIKDCASYSQSITGNDSVGSIVGGWVGEEINGWFATGTFTLENCSAISTLDGVGAYYTYDDGMGDYTLDPTYDLSAYNSAVTFIPPRPASTTLQVGINGDSSCQISFDTNFQFDLSSLEGNIASDEAFTQINDFINMLSEKSTQLGSIQNRLDSALGSIEVNLENLISSRSTIRDADIAEESSEYIRQQILQQASATLLATANQSPSIALQLI